jgi:hypothetical protein
MFDKLGRVLCSKCRTSMSVSSAESIPGAVTLHFYCPKCAIVHDLLRAIEDPWLPLPESPPAGG